MKAFSRVAAIALCGMLIVGALGSRRPRHHASEASGGHVEFLWFIGGTLPVEERNIPMTDEPATCHEHEVVDLRTGRVIGTAIDCTRDFSAVGDATVATGTTTFFITRGRWKGTLQIRGRGTIQPEVSGSPEQDPPAEPRSPFYALRDEPTPITHIAGIFPEEGENQVLYADGAFEGATGQFALFGALDLGRDDGQVSFNCIFDIDLDIPRRGRGDDDDDDD